MSASVLSSLLEIRYGVQYLKELSTDDPNAVVKDDNRILGACEDSIGDFERVTGITHDTENLSHRALLVQGALYYLDMYKSKDSSHLDKMGKNFYAGLKNMRGMVYLTPQTNSNLKIKRESANTRPDMDKNRRLFSYGKRVPGGLVEEIESNG